MRLWYHPESDALFYDVEWPGQECEDVTDVPKFRKAAKDRGIRVPEVTSEPMTSITFANKPATTLATAIVQSYKKWERKPADLYPTPVDGTESVIPALKVLAEYAGGMRVWEPACGDGRLARVLEHHGFQVDATDLRPYSGYGNVRCTRDTISGGFDFLNDDPVRKWGWEPKPDLIVTNPPFSLAEQFIKKALTYTPNVAMLLKQSYWNAASRLPFFHEHRPAFVLPLTFRLAFLEEERGKSPIMDCCWVIWSQENTPEDPCVFEPIMRRRYPGYAKKGVLSATEILEGEIAALIEALRA